MKDASATAMSHMAIGTGSTAAAAGDAALGNEAGRVALTSTTVTSNAVAYVATFAAGGPLEWACTRPILAALGIGGALQNPGQMIFSMSCLIADNGDFIPASHRRSCWYRTRSWQPGRQLPGGPESFAPGQVRWRRMARHRWRVRSSGLQQGCQPSPQAHLLRFLQCRRDAIALDAHAR